MRHYSVGLYHIAFTLLWLSLAACVLFVVLYFWLARWWTTNAGRHVMTFMIVLTLLFGYVYAGAMGWLRAIPADTLLWVQVILFGAFFITVCWRIGILLREQLFPMIRRKRAERNGDQSD